MIEKQYLSCVYCKKDVSKKNGWHFCIEGDKVVRIMCVEENHEKN